MVRSLPGISFQTQPMEMGDKLPRMDVVAFVGFAASGPVDVPVPVEDEVRFREIFGADLDLAWDPQASAMHRSYLGPAVRSFFRNGGRRAWVVRVAREAESNRFVVPGLMSFPRAQSVTVQARSEGAWSDSLRAGTTLVRTPLVRSAFRVTDSRAVVEITTASRELIRSGDLLRVTFDNDGLVLFLTVDVIEEERRVADSSRHVYQVRGREFWFTSGATLQPGQVEVRLPHDGGLSTESAFHRPPRRPGEPHRLYFTSGELPLIGSLVEIRPSGTLLSVSESYLADPYELDDLALPATAGMKVAVCRDPLCPVPRETAYEAAGEAESIECVTFDLWVEDGQGKLSHLKGLGFTREHPRFLGYLPTDAALFLSAAERGPFGDGPPPGEALWRDAAHPRFPLAAMSDQAELYLPIGMDLVLDRDHFVRPEPTGRPVPVRNGLGKLSGAVLPDLFLDRDLADESIQTLPSSAFHKRYTLGRRLTRAHSLWNLEEVTLLAVPDAAHPYWSEVNGAEAKPLPAPSLPAAEHDPAACIYRLTWRPVEGATGYQLQEAADPDFTVDTHSQPIDGTESILPVRAQQQYARYYRLRAASEGHQGPWSATLSLKHGQPDPCGNAAVERQAGPDLELIQADRGTDRFVLRWKADPLDQFTLQEAFDSDFAEARVVYQGAGTGTVVVRPGERLTYYRVRSEAGHAPGLWSNTVTMNTHRPEMAWRVLPPPVREDELEADREVRANLHRALLRLACARGDLFVVLSMPSHYREPDVAAYTSHLVTEMRYTDESALSFGGLYHPWTYYRESNGQIRLTPPDGPITGTVASRAMQRGAWVAPANVGLTGVVGLYPPLGDHEWRALTYEQVNVIRQDPRGFLALSARTLSPDPDYRSIGVRRLLCQLRRLALRDATQLVFAPNTDTFRRMVHYKVEYVLAQLFMRGAFAGRTAAESFQVVTGPVVNPPESLAQGRFVVEVRVAPTEPLRFITVRLVQAHSERPVVTEG